MSSGDNRRDSQSPPIEKEDGRPLKVISPRKTPSGKGRYSRHASRIRDALATRGSTLSDSGDLVPPPWLPEVEAVLENIPTDDGKERAPLYFQVCVLMAVVCFVLMFTGLMFVPQGAKAKDEAAPWKNAASQGQDQGQF